MMTLQQASFLLVAPVGTTTCSSHQTPTLSTVSFQSGRWSRTYVGPQRRWKHPYPKQTILEVDGSSRACRNGTHTCDAAQTCLWMSVGCTIVQAVYGGSQGGTNPNGKDRVAPL